MISVNELALVGFGVIILYLLWERHRMEVQMGHMAEQHNKLCGLIEELAQQIADDMDELEEKINK